MNTNATTIKEDISKNIISLFEINKLPEEKQVETLNKIGEIIFQSVLLRILPLLDDKEIEEYNNLIEKKSSPDEIFEFLYEKVPSFSKIIMEETENFRKESADVLKEF